MNRTLWKLQQIGERLWILAAITATQAAALGNDGRGFAVVAEETRKMTEKMQNLVEKALFEGEDINKDMLSDLALMLNLLALNAAIEAFHLSEKGKQAAVCAEEIRTLAYDIVRLFDEQLEEKFRRTAQPWPRNPLTTQHNFGCSFLSFDIAGIPIKENLVNIYEVISGYVECTDGFIKLRKKEYSVINGSKILGRALREPTYIILQSPWSEQDKTYAVAVDSISGIFSSPIGTPISIPADMPLAKYVRECRENENGDPFYFMDWPKMI